MYQIWTTYVRRPSDEVYRQAPFKVSLRMFALTTKFYFNVKSGMIHQGDCGHLSMSYPALNKQYMQVYNKHVGMLWESAIRQGEALTMFCDGCMLSYQRITTSEAA